MAGATFPSHVGRLMQPSSSCEQLLLLSMKAQGVNRAPFIWFWPDGAQGCITMTHDIETEKGKKLLQGADVYR